MVSYPITLLAFGCLFVAAQSADIVHFSVERAPKEKSRSEVFNKFKEAIKKRHWVFRSHETRKTKRLGSFQWKNCGAVSKELLVIENLSIVPDPIHFPGSITLNMNATFNKTLDAPLKVDLELEKEIFGVWIKVPCVDNVGSCSYADICSMLASSTCPVPFVQQNVPCKCPFPKGSYTLTNAAFSLKLPSSPLENGDFRVTANLSMDGVFVGCYAIELSLSD